MNRSKLIGNTFSNLFVAGIVISVVGVCAAQQCAQVPVLTFEGLRDSEPILNYYNGGRGANSSGPGPNYGVTFEGQSLAIVSDLSTGPGGNPGRGDFSNAPSGVTSAYFLSGVGVIMNVAAGFTTGFSVYYAAANTAGSITVYDGLHGSGNVLATVQLPVNGSNCGPATYSCWSPVGVAFSGTAKSVNFGGAANFIGFDNITVGSVTPGIIASMAQLASAGGWDTSINLVNMGSSAACSSLQFYADPNGGPLGLPLTFPQGAISATTASSVNESIEPNALLVMDTTGPSNQVSVGWANMQAAGDVAGYGVFTNTQQNWEAVVPLVVSNANSYLLPFDNTSFNNTPLSTGLAIANLSTQPATVNVSIHNDSGFQIDNETIQLQALGHTSFTLATQYAKTAGIRGSLVFVPQSGGQISVLGLRANGPALTTVPVLANVQKGIGSMAHVTYDNGWNTTITLVNTGSAAATPTLSFYGDDGSPLAVPLFYPQTGTSTSTATIKPMLTPGQVLIMQTQGKDAIKQSTSGSAVLTSSGAVGGSAIFRYSPSGQEGIVPLETRNATAYVLGFDNTSGRVTGMALANSTSKAANLALTIRDDKGTTIATDSIPLNANGHTQTVLNSGYPATAGKRGTVEIDGPAGFSALGLFVSPTGNVTTLPTLKK